MPPPELPPLPLEAAISEAFIDCTDSVGLDFHILECGRDDRDPKPLVLLIHGFPELAFSWRKVMPSIAQAGFHVVAADQRGYGRTRGWRRKSYHDTDLQEYTLLRYVQDAVALVTALGYDQVKCLVGHDAGAAVAAQCALARPDMFTNLILMSHPFKAIPALSRARHLPSPEAATKVVERDPDIQSSLAKLTPPRKPYKWYNATPEAADHWENPSQGLATFLRGYLHLKSGDCRSNEPHPLKSWTAPELAQMPHYYVMPLAKSMPDTVASDMTAERNPDATKAWLSDDDLAVYVDEWQRTGFQAALNFYRVATTPSVSHRETLSYAGAKLTVPCMFLSGDRDWGNYQEPGALDKMAATCLQFRGVKFVPGAGHWPQQEKPDTVVSEILGFMAA